MVRFSLLLPFLFTTFIFTSCEFSSVEKVCVPLSGECIDGDPRGRLMCNEWGTGWVQSDCATGSFCSEGECSNVGGGELTVVTTGLPDGMNYEAYSVALEATGGVPPFGWNLIDGELPEGLTLGSDGGLFGTTKEAGTWELTFMVTDYSQPPAYTVKSFDLTMEISPMTMNAEYSYEYMGQSINILPVLIPYVEYRGELGVKGGLPPHTWANEEPPAMLSSFIPFWGLPAGLSRDDEGVITGTVEDTSDANQVQIPGATTTLTGYFLYLSVTDSNDPAATITGLFLIPTIPL